MKMFNNIMTAILMTLFFILLWRVRKRRKA